MARTLAKWAARLRGQAVSDAGRAAAGLAKLAAIKERTWFYEFELPDGTKTRSDVSPEILVIHTSRRQHLRRIIETRVDRPDRLTAIDFASHEGYFSVELAKHFSFVRGFEIRDTSLAAARLIAEVLAVDNVEFRSCDLQEMRFDPTLSADFVLVYGLIYHVEDPVHVLRLASQLCRRHILIESQVFPYDVSGRIEDGAYDNMRPIKGVFGLAPDYPSGREGGSTELALIPSLNALLFLLETFGFTQVEVLPPDPDDYEQFRRGSRVMIYGCKA